MHADLGFDLFLITLLAVLVSLFSLTLYAFVRCSQPLVIFLTFLARCRILTIGFDQLCVLFVITNLVNSLTVIPGGLGLFEATRVGYASLAQLGDDKGAALALISRLVMEMRGEDHGAAGVMGMQRVPRIGMMDRRHVEANQSRETFYA